MSTLITAQGLTHLFGPKRALNQVDLNLEAGSPIALVGPNGAGKTTLFSILCGYLTPSSGNISVLGHAPGSAELFGQVSALPQDALLDPSFSVQQQLVLYAKLQGFSNNQAKQECERVLELVNLPEIADQRPHALSHGMKKRVCIAQALIGSPKLVLLDEATAGLDPANARAIRELVSRLSNEITFILSSHDLSELERLCDRVLYLQKGELRTHSVAHNEQAQLQYITLQLRDENPVINEQLAQLSHVQSVKSTQKNEIVITFTPSDEPMDVRILQLCHQHKWRYRALINGHTLENQLFTQGD